MQALLEAVGLVKHFDVETGGFFRRTKTALKAVEGVDLLVQLGEPADASSNPAAANPPSAAR